MNRTFSHYLCLIGGLALGLTLGPSVMQAQDAAVIHACYVPTTGLIYRIKEDGLSQACLTETHVEFQWAAGVLGGSRIGPGVQSSASDPVVGLNTGSTGVPAAGTPIGGFFANGDIEVVGTMTAIGFAGDGQQLTNLDPANINSGTFSGTFDGDGSGLWGVPPSEHYVDDGNIVVGSWAFFENTTGSDNTATGHQALRNNTTGNNNTAIGHNALLENTTGNGNIGLGRDAGINATTGHNNIFVANDGVTGDDATIKIGTQGTQTSTFIAGIEGTPLAGTPVVVTAGGQLGTGSPSTGDLPTGCADTQLAKWQTSGSVWVCGDDNDTQYTDAEAVAAVESGDLTVAGDVTATNFVGNGSGLTSLPASTHDLGNSNTGVGQNALASNTTGAYNTATGFLALFANTTGQSNTATGYYALSSNTTGYSNIAAGQEALYSNTMGHSNTAAGFHALRFNTTGYANTATGLQALSSNTTGHSNTAAGLQALRYNTTGGYHTAAGTFALGSNTTGTNNTAAGAYALYSNTTGTNNTAVGYMAGHDATNGDNNIFIANDGVAGDDNVIRIGTQGTQTSTFIAGIDGTPLAGTPVVVTASGQLGTGSASGGDHGELSGLTDDDHMQYLVANGVRDAANGFAVTGTFNTGSIPISGGGTRLMWYPRKAAFRVGQLCAACTDWNDASIGGYSVAMGYGPRASGNYSVAVGQYARASGHNSAAIGYYAEATADYGMAIGRNVNADGQMATAMGYSTTADGTAATALGGGTTASADYSTALGRNTTASQHAATAMGEGTTADAQYATAIGYNTTAQAFRSVVLGQYNLISGSQWSWVATDPLFVVGNGTSSSAPANALTLLKDGKLGIGTPTPADLLHVAGDIRVGTGTNGCVYDADGSVIAGTCSSDVRLKRNVVPLSSLLPRIAQLRPVSFSWRTDEFPERRLGDATQLGLIAQEVERVLPELVAEGDDGFKRVRYSDLPMLLLQAIKEQQAMIAELTATVQRLEGTMAGREQ